MCRSADVALFDGFVTLDAGADDVEYAHRLFDLLRRADKLGAEAIFAPLPEKSGLSLALYNRIIRAAGCKIIRRANTYDTAPDDGATKES